MWVDELGLSHLDHFPGTQNVLYMVYCYLCIVAITLRLLTGEVGGLLGAKAGFEIVISHIFGKSTKFGGAIKSGVLIQWQKTQVLRTRADLGYSYALIPRAPHDLCKMT